MREINVDHLPELSDERSEVRLDVRGLRAFLYAEKFVACLDLSTGAVDWLVEQVPSSPERETWELRRRAVLLGRRTWVDASGGVAAEMQLADPEHIALIARDARTGRHLWDVLIPLPATDDTTIPPPGSGMEIFKVCLVDDPDRLVIVGGILADGSKRPLSSRWAEAVRIDPRNGSLLWRSKWTGIHVAQLTVDDWRGLWSCGSRVGTTDFEVGTLDVFYESSSVMLCPVHHDGCVVVPWLSMERKEVGVDWLDGRGVLLRRGVFPRSDERSAALHVTEAGLALQTNEQKLRWLGDGIEPRWTMLGKPYIYRVHRFPETEVFVGTDGRGGRVLAFDPDTGRETFSLKPTAGGGGTLTKVPGHDLLVAKYWNSKRDSVSGRLLVLSARTKEHRLTCDCRQLLGTGGVRN